MQRALRILGAAGLIVLAGVGLIFLAAMIRVGYPYVLGNVNPYHPGESASFQEDRWSWLALAVLGLLAMVFAIRTLWRLWGALMWERDYTHLRRDSTLGFLCSAFAVIVDIGWNSSGW